MASIEIACVSWIDIENIPQPAFYKPIFDWESAVALGLRATSNPRPTGPFVRASTIAKKHYRGLSASRLVKTAEGAVFREVGGDLSDPGYTPPFDAQILGVNYSVEKMTALVAWLTTDKEFHEGEKHQQSSIVSGKLHRHSVLADDIHRHGGNDFRVIVNALLKFRAGRYTDEVGIEKAGSKFHVPWVWHEFALVELGKYNYKFFGRASRFPSHKWYIAGQEVGYVPQMAVLASPGDPMLRAGLPKDVPIELVSSQCDGPVGKHPNALAPGELIVFNATSLIRSAM
ncbi:hypothetical protein ACQ859_17590 [Roseateles chitinivorans]|uniref:hypothetical protein n=1 Tax=Roseateles chitinivorans TaxID=2917965 RepID=UPI003D66D5DF